MRSTRILTRYKPVVFLILTFVLGCGFARGQYMSYSDSYSKMLNTTMVASQSLFRAQTAVNQQRENMRAAGQSGNRSTNTRQTQQSQQQQQPAIGQYPITATDFQALSPPIMPDEFANSATGVDQATRETMRNFFQQVLTSFESKARKDNLANAFAFICGASLQVRNGKEPSNAEIDQMIASFNNRLASSTAYYTYNPRQQQMLYESLILNGAIIAFLDDQGKKTNNPQMRAQAQQLSSAVLKSFLGM